VTWPGLVPGHTPSFGGEAGEPRAPSGRSADSGRDWPPSLPRHHQGRIFHGARGRIRLSRFDSPNNGIIIVTGILVAKPVIMAQLQDRGVDEALGQPLRRLACCPRMQAICGQGVVPVHDQ